MIAKAANKGFEYAELLLGNWLKVIVEVMIPGSNQKIIEEVVIVLSQTP